MLPAPGFHHLHLNSVDPDAAIEFYTRQFPSTREGQLGRLSGAPVAQRRAGAVHQGRHAAADRAAERDLAFRLACHRRRRQPRGPSKRGREVELLPLYTTDEGGSVLISSDTWPSIGGVLGLTRAQIADAQGEGRRAGPAAAALPTCGGPDDALVEIRRQPSRPSASTTSTCGRRTRSARCSWYQKHLNAPMRPGYAPTPVTEADCKVRARRRSHLAGAEPRRHVPHAARRRRVRRCGR